MATNTARVTTHVEIDNKNVRLEDAKILEQFTSERAAAMYKEAMEKFPNIDESDLGRYARNKAIAIENGFRKTGAKIVRPLLNRLYNHAIDQEQEDLDKPMLRIDDLLVPVPNSNLKKWQANGYVTIVEDKDDEGKVYLHFTEKGCEAAQEVEK